MKAIKSRLKFGNHIVADPEICHGKPTFAGTRIMVLQVLRMLADGMSWESVVEQCHNRITKEAIAEAISLATMIFADHAHQYVYDHIPEHIAA